MTFWIKQHKFFFLAIFTILVLVIATFSMLQKGWIGVEPLELDVMLLVNNNEFNII